MPARNKKKGNATTQILSRVKFLIDKVTTINSFFGGEAAFLKVARSAVRFARNFWIIKTSQISVEDATESDAVKSYLLEFSSCLFYERPSAYDKN